MNAFEADRMYFKNLYCLVFLFYFLFKHNIKKSPFNNIIK